MLNRSASLALSTSVLEAFPGKLDIKRHSPSILYLQYPLCFDFCDIHIEAGFNLKDLWAYERSRGHLNFASRGY